MAPRLRDDLHWCNASGKAVFLDLEAGRYFSLPGTINQAFLHLASGAPECQDQSLLTMLIKRGLLIEEPGCVSIQSPASIEPPTRDYLPEASLRPSLIPLGRELASELERAWALHWQSIALVIRAAAYQGSRKGHVPRDPHRSLKAIVAGAYSASLVSRAHDRCLVRALAVKSLCNRSGIEAKLVFGVIANPFSAHCWVQFGGAVLVGGFEQARLFTPILVVE